jgi:hypothetical protein
MYVNIYRMPAYIINLKDKEKCLAPVNIDVGILLSFCVTQVAYPEF